MRQYIRINSSKYMFEDYSNITSNALVLLTGGQSLKPFIVQLDGSREVAAN